jgi:simple sugar transport system permease protein
MGRGKGEKLTAFQEYKRQELKFSMMKTLLAILISIGIVFAVIMLVCDEPVEAVISFVTGPFTTKRRFGNVIEAAIPLIFTGLAACIMLQAKQFSLIGDGAFYLGALASIAVSLALPNQGVLNTIISILTGGIVGAACGVIPGFLKAKWKTNEFVVSMMFNYVLTYLGLYFLLNVLRDPSSGFVATYALSDTVKLPKLISGTKVHFGLIIALVMVVICYLFIFRPRFGFAIRMTGSNEKFSKHIGFNTFQVIFLVQVIGGFLAGMGGTVELFGMYDRFQWQATLGFGFDGMTVAILAANNPALVPIGALFLAYIRVGTEIMARVNSIPNETVYIIQGIIMLLITANGFLVHWRHRQVVATARRRENGEEEARV